MITETTAVTLRQNLGDMLNRVQYRRESIVITKDGKPVAALVDAALFNRFRALQDRFDALCERLGKRFDGDAVGDGGAKAQAEVERISAEARRQVAQDWRRAGRLPELQSVLQSAPVAAEPLPKPCLDSKMSVNVQPPKPPKGRRKAI